MTKGDKVLVILFRALIVDWSNNNRSGAEYCSLVPCLPLARGLAP
jgi:hypothetical protein